ncbi:NUDIX domain-containing protein [uncultured Bacteroides sp.]|uniref:NUDIX hydrolase n=1 Tax=uncultured Bacteroides sp. TaxID=162156 RepID=UPI002631FA8C|nr:NUDIX domain-containing protein [uncultured Bacteroides sp.]
MEKQTESNQIIDVHVSVDCVLIGFDGEQFRVLLVRQIGKQPDADVNDLKLPGSLIYADEDLDEAAKRVLNELTGLKNVKMTQFKAYGSKNRTADPRDVMWLERFHRITSNKVGRIVTIAYLSLLKIDNRYRQLSDTYDACWTPVSEVKNLAFDHTEICKDALTFVRHYVENVPSVMFDLLPRKFTVAQLRLLYQLIYDREFDARNFHKKIAQMPYVVPMEEKEKGVRHRAARYYRFDRTIYNKYKK